MGGAPTAFSLRSRGARGGGGSFDIIEHCRSIGLAGVQTNPPSTDPAEIKKFRARLEANNMHLICDIRFAKQDSDLAAVAEPDANRRAQVANEFNVPGRYTSAEEMLAKEALDIVAVATPNKSHMPLTVAALRKGCHVLCEKPMAMNAAEARLMLEAARKADRRVMINFSYRFTPQSQALRREVDRGALGNLAAASGAP